MKYSEERISSIHRNFLPSVAFIRTLRLQNMAFYTKQDIPRALSFPRVFFRFLPETIDCEQKRLSLEGHLEIEADAVKYIHTYIFTS